MDNENDIDIDEVNIEDLKLNQKQKIFCEEYIIDLNATQSAIRAGYSEKTSYSIGQRLLKKVEIQIYIEKLMKEKEDKRIAKQDEVLEFLTKVMRGEEKDAFGLDANLQDRTKCAELLGKRYGTFKEQVNLGGAVPVVIADDITE